jgi:hypothetical protein
MESRLCLGTGTAGLVAHPSWASSECELNAEVRQTVWALLSGGRQLVQGFRAESELVIGFEHVEQVLRLSCMRPAQPGVETFVIGGQSELRRSEQRFWKPSRSLLKLKLGLTLEVNRQVH